MLGEFGIVGFPRRHSCIIMQRALALDTSKPRGAFPPASASSHCGVRVSLFSKARAVGSLSLKIFGEIGNGGGIREDSSVVRAPGLGPS